MFFPFEEQLTQEQDMVSSSLAKSGWCIIWGRPAFQSISPTEPLGDFTDVVFRVLHNQFYCFVVGFFMCHWILIPDALTIIWPISFAKTMGLNKSQKIISA